MLSHFWPMVTGKTFFDVWTLAHLGFWVFIGSSIWPIIRDKGFKSRTFWFGGCFIAAIIWELFEKMAEPTWPHLWLNPESFVNSWISDPLTCVVGVLGMWYLQDRYAGKR